jgi:hypothetical protein
MKRLKSFIYKPTNTALRGQIKSMETTAKPSIEEMNKVIQVFMGLPSEKDRPLFSGGSTKEPWTLKYHDDWNVLMNVVEKIESLGYKFQICRKRVTVLEDSGSQPHVLSCKMDNKLRAVHSAVYDFIIWYNKHTSQP